MVDKNYFHLLHRPFSLVKLALHAFFFWGACARLFIVHHQNICRSSSLRVFASAYILTPLTTFCSWMWWSVAVMFVDVSFFSSVRLCCRGCPVLLFIQHSYRTIITITYRHYVTNFFRNR